MSNLKCQLSCHLSENDVFKIKLNEASGLIYSLSLTLHSRSWHGWFKDLKIGKDILTPDVSRVYRRPYEGLSEEADLLTELFNRDRMTNL